MAMGVMSLLGFYLVDSIFVARLGTAPLAAQSFTFPLAFLVIGVQVGIGIAIAALISRAIGAGQQEQANRLGALVLVGGGVLQGLLVLVLWLIQEPAFALLGASEEIRAMIRPFWALQVPAMWVGGVVYFGYSLFRAHGNTRFPGMMMVLTSLLNLLFDPILIFGIGDWQGFGLPGAALATLLAFSIGGVIVALSLRGKGWVQRTGMLVQMRASAWPFAQIAGPAMISQLMPPLAAMVATALVARSGDQAVAAWGMASRLESFSIVLVLGMTMALPPWLGRCYGANDWATVRRLMQVATGMVVAWQVLLGLVMALLAAPLASVLVDTPA
ncbi:MAG TPA: MATE family efflux transporter, partial [Alcanivorax sp.]|nr:MATE family efflux transporter [Alcanivorax sp.]